ncbi:hypothetical protein EC991_011063 [Linnemannia zychae]|nr:hypothetical protein EC991_011063 [Linnemannia zychae]
MSGDINAALSKVTPEKSAFLVDAWRAYEGIPDVPTFKFIGALMDLEFEIVRYWFYCRSNRDGIKRAYAQSAARGSTEGIVLPALEDYHLLDKFSEDMDWNYQVPEDEIQEQEEEEPTSTSSTSGPQHQRKKLPNVASASITSKALTTIDLSEPSCNTGTRRSRAPQTLPKSTQESAEENKLTSNDDESEAEETGILGSCGTGSSRTYASSSKASRSMKRATQQSSGEVPRKRGRPLGSFKRHKNATRTKQQPPPRTPSPTPNTAEHSSSTDSSRTNTPKRYLTPVILIPRVAPRTPVVVESTSSTLPASKGSEPELEPEAESITLQPDKATKEDSSAVQKIDQADINSSQSTEPMTLSTSARTPSLAMDPIAGTDSKSKFLEQQQITGHRERRAKARTQSKGPVKAPAKIPTKAPDKAISATVSTGVATRVKSRKRKVLYQSEEEGHDDKGDNGNEDIGGGASVQLQNRPNSIGNSEAKKVEKVKAPLTIIPGSTHSFYKEFASIKPKRREKLPAQEQPPTVPLSVEIPLASTLASGAEPQQLRSLNNLAISHPLLAKPTTPTISSQVQSGDSGVQYSYSHPAIDSAEHIDPAALLEQERIASRKRDEERRIQETDKFQDFGDDLRPKEYRSNDEYWDDIRHPADEKRRIQSRRRHGSYSRGRSHSQARDRSRGQSQRRSSSPSRRRSRNKPRGRSRNQRPLILRPLTFQGVSHDRQSPPRSRNDSQQDVNACANGVPSPQLHTTRGCSFDDIRSPYSPEPFDPAVILAAAALPASEALPRLPSPFLQSHRTQSRNTHNPDDRRRFSKSEEPGANWSTTHSHRRLSQISSLEKSRSLMEIKRLPSRTVGSGQIILTELQAAEDFANSETVKTAEITDPRASITTTTTTARRSIRACTVIVDIEELAVSSRPIIRTILTHQTTTTAAMTMASEI